MRNLINSAIGRAQGLVTLATTSLHSRLSDGLSDTASSTEAKLERERGDVPGWVLIVLMTAGLVVAIWALAGPALSEVFTEAITRVRSQ